MLCMIVNRTRPDLSASQREELGRLAQDFYDNVPEGVTLHGDWAATDGSCTFSVVEVEESALLERVQEPFRRFVDMEVVPVVAVRGWGKR